MKTVKDVMVGNVLVITKTSSVASAVNQMANNKVSCLVVMDDDGPSGILTERDLVHKVMVPSKNQKKTKVEEVMNGPLVAVKSSATLEDASAVMQSASIRRLPVIDDKKLLGIVTETDIVKEMSRLARREHKLDLYQNLQSWILIAFFILLSVILVFRLV